MQAYVSIDRVASQRYGKTATLTVNIEYKIRFGQAERREQHEATTASYEPMLLISRAIPWLVVHHGPGVSSNASGVKSIGY